MIEVLEKEKEEFQRDQTLGSVCPDPVGMSPVLNPKSRPAMMA